MDFGGHMETADLLNETVLLDYLMKFTDYVRFRDQKPSEKISFRDSSGVLGREEGYKSFIAEDTRKEFHLSEWKENWIGTGKIEQYATKAITKSNNLVFPQQKFTFQNILNPAREEYKKEAEGVLYRIFRGDDDEEAYNAAVNCFGAKYDLIAFLFFIKDDTRFLPISPKNFDKSFEKLKIDFKTAYHCNWENYKKYNKIISEIGNYMDKVLPLYSDVRLMDAHSFVWILHGKSFEEWEANHKNEGIIEKRMEQFLLEYKEGNGKRYATHSSVFNRSQEVVKIVKKRANGICQLCKQPAPFCDKNGQPYLEVHHIKWLSRGGKDSTDNAVALCPNCHTKMHVVDDEEDVEKLLRTLG